MNRRWALAWLLASTALCATPAAAQESLGHQSLGSESLGRRELPGAGDLLADPIMTAARRPETVNGAPLSVSLFGEATLQQTRTLSAADLPRIAPGLAAGYPWPGYSGDYSYSLRGLSGPSGAATVGMFLGEVPVHRRVALGPGAGPAAPKLFDIERVEVLRGPQGVLWGGSTLGGAVRFVAAEPSLTRYSALARADVSTVKDGGAGYEAGVAVGGPIRFDRLGFRASAYTRAAPGFVDQVSRFTGARVAENTNTGRDVVLRLAVAWAATDRLQVTPAIHWQREIRRDTDQYLENMPAYADASGVYGPYTGFGPYRSANVLSAADGSERAVLSPRRETDFLPSLTLDYEFDTATFRSTTAYLEQRVKGLADDTLRTGLAPLTGGTAESLRARHYFNHRAYRNNLTRLSQEFRFASSGSASPLGWVGGAFFSRARHNARALTHTNQADVLPLVLGADERTLFGGVESLGGLSLDAGEAYVETTAAAFGQLDYRLADRLTVTAGLRLAGERLDYTAYAFGPSEGGWRAPGGPPLVQGRQLYSPVTPKLGLTYELGERDLLFLTAAKGYRTGGVNNPAHAGRCGGDFARLAPGALPAEFGPDSVWSYEGGAKLSLLGGRMQLNGAAFYARWDRVQAPLNLDGCGPTYTANAGRAVSKGFEIESQARAGPATLSFALALTDARYTDPLFAPDAAGAPALLLRDGDRVPFVPRVAYVVGLRFDFEAAGLPGYVRADHRYGSPSYRTPGPGTLGHNPALYRAEAYSLVGLRAGLMVRNIELAAYAENLFNAQDALFRFGGGAGGYNPAITAQTWRPRELGLSATARF